MASTEQQRPQRLGDIAQRASIAYFRTQATPSLPTGRYAADGDFYLDLPESLVGSPLVATFLLVLERNFPGDATDCDGPFCEVTTIWAHWLHAQRAEAIARLFWPGLTVTAKGNPRYRQGGDVVKQLADARRAIVAAEALVRCGLAVGR